MVVCKSLSKVYALSGVRAAYLVATEEIIEELRSLTPPWAVSLPAQVAAVYALQESDYYTTCYLKTHELRDLLARGIRTISPAGEVITGVGNWVLWYPLSSEGSPAELVRWCRSRGLFVREVGGWERESGRDALRIAVKDRETQKHIVEILAWAMRKKGSLSQDSV